MGHYGKVTLASNLFAAYKMSNLKKKTLQFYFYLRTRIAAKS